jgi:hypothetical protein
VAKAPPDILLKAIKLKQISEFGGLISRGFY